MTTQQAQKISDLLRAQLEENLHNRLTQACATGILTLFNKELESMVSVDAASVVKSAQPASSPEPSP
jgi:hypothetical protein